jgi:hypothetical protein
MCFTEKTVCFTKGKLWVLLGRLCLNMFTAENSMKHIKHKRLYSDVWNCTYWMIVRKTDNTVYYWSSIMTLFILLSKFYDCKWLPKGLAEWLTWNGHFLWNIGFISFSCYSCCTFKKSRLKWTAFSYFLRLFLNTLKFIYVWKFH